MSILRELLKVAVPTVAVCEGGSGLRFVWRDGDASACVEVSKPRGYAIAAVSRIRGGRGVSIGCGPRLFVGVSKVKREWLDADPWRKYILNTPEGRREDARQTWVRLSPREVSWGWDAPQAKIMRGEFPEKPTLRLGAVNFKHMALTTAFGPIKTEERKYRRGVEIHLPEGTYKSEAHRVMTEAFFERHPEWRRVVANKVCITIPNGIAMPFKGKGDAITDSLRYKFETEGGAGRAGSITHAVEFITKDIVQTREKLCGYAWVPPMRVRRKGEVAVAWSTLPKLPPDSESVAWEKRDPITGEWSDLGMMPKTDLPAGVRIEEMEGWTGTAAVALGVAGIAAAWAMMGRVRGG